MKITPLNYYPTFYNPENNFLCGTMHVCLNDMGIELLGIQFVVKNDKWWFYLKGGKGTDHKGKPCFYPYFRIQDEKKKKDFTKTLMDVCVPFIEEYKKKNDGVLIALYKKSKDRKPRVNKKNFNKTIEKKSKVVK